MCRRVVIGGTIALTSTGNFYDDFESLLSSYNVDTNPYNWYSYELHLDHFEKHNENFGAIDTKDFARMSEEFYNNRDNYQVKVDRFGSYDSDGKAKTFYKPTEGQNHFNGQREA